MSETIIFGQYQRRVYNVFEDLEEQASNRIHFKVVIKRVGRTLSDPKPIGFKSGEIYRLLL